MNAGRRDLGKCFIPIKEDKKHLLDAPIEAYFCFKSVDGELISDSVYLGNINGPAKDKQEQERDEQYTQVKDRFELKSREDILLFNSKQLLFLPHNC